MELTRQQEVRRTATFQPSTLNERERTVELVIATEAVVDGIILSCRSLPNWGPAPVPVLLSHQNDTARMAGRIENLRIENRRLIGLARFIDAPAADEGWALARSGSAVSVGASLDGGSLEPHSKTADIARNWRLREASLVPCGADVNCVTRSHNQTPLEDDMTTATNAQTTATETTGEVQRSAAELKREASITRMVHRANLPPDFADELVESGESIERCSIRIFERMRDGLSPSRAGHPAAAAPSADGPQGVAAQIERALVKGERLAQPLWLTLRDQGYARGNNALDVITRGLSTSDLPGLLTESGNRALLDRFSSATGGILAAATVRDLVDYRNASILDVAQVGAAEKILEGGEIKFGSVSETRLNYRPYRYGRGLSISPEAIANDDLAAFAEALGELAEAALDAEKTELVALLTANTNEGAVCADGSNLFATAHNNTATGGVGVTGLGTAVSKLRKQTTIGGRYVDQMPGAVMCSPGMELTVRQVLSERLFASDPENINPWRDLTVEVEPRLGDTYVYLITKGPRMPLQLGRLSAAPMLESETDFSTGFYRAKATHAFGAAVQEFRGIVRLAS